MEIVLAFLLFFGGLAAGSMNAENGADELQSTSARPPADDASDTLQVTQTTRPSYLIRCDAHGTLIYRDLTLPIGGPDRPRTEQPGGLEGTRPDD